MPISAVRVQEKGQVTIPKEIREKLDIKKGDLVTFVETEAGILLQPAQIVVSAALDEIGRALQEEGLSLEQMVERGRWIRGGLVEEHYGVSDDSTE